MRGVGFEGNSREVFTAQRLVGKRTLITGGASGMGRAIAESYKKSGAEVWAVDADPNALAAMEGTSPGGIIPVTLDVTDGVAITDLAARIGRLDALVNCAGIVPHGALLDCTEADWDRCFTVNVKSMYFMIAAFLPEMRKTPSGGAIINIASVVSSLKGAANRAAYGASKGAVIGLTKSVAADYAADGIRCNAICPGVIETPSLVQRFAAQPDPAAAREAFVARHPIGQLGKPEQIAEFAIYLASDAGAFASGAAYVIDGGLSQ